MWISLPDYLFSPDVAKTDRQKKKNTRLPFFLSLPRRRRKLCFV